MSSDHLTRASLPERVPGEDPLWDSLGDDWQAVDGLHPLTPRLYIRWNVVDGQRPEVTGICVAGGKITTEMLRAVPISRMENLRSLVDDGRPADEFAEPLARRAGESAAEFSERVARYYRVFAAFSSSPTKDLAEHSGVPLPTMRTWIREARLRGSLPPGTQGKAG
jgi:hypothetical protein